MPQIFTIFKKNFFYLLLLTIILLSFIKVTSAERNQLTFFEVGVKDSMATVQTVFTQIGNNTSKWFASVLNAGKLKDENNKLRDEINRLQGEIYQMEEYKQQNLQLKELLDYKNQYSNQFDLITASVIGRDPSNWFSTMTLNRGTIDGVEKDMAVVNNQGLIGRIISASLNSSEVLLLTDPRSAVGSLIQETRVPGIVEGLSQSAGKLKMIHIPNDQEVKVGQLVITSGLGELFPKGILLGKIESIEKEPNGLLKSAVVVPSINFDILEEVFIISDYEIPIGSQSLDDSSSALP